MIEEILENVNKVRGTDYTIDQLLSRRRFRGVCDTRFFVFYVLRHIKGYGVSEIAEKFNYTHGSVCNGLNAIKDLCTTSVTTRRTIEKLKELYGYETY